MPLLRPKGDMWAQPPGGPVPASSARSRWAPIAFGLAVTLVLGGGLAYSSMRASTAVSGEDALAEFQAATADRDEAERSSRSGTVKRKQKRDRKRAGARRRTETERRAQERNVAAAPAPGAENGSGAEPASEPNATRRQQPNGSNGGSDVRARPKEGVYAWQVDGYEQAPGVRRDLPARSHRVITHEGDRAWVEHHIFSEEREQWMNLAFHPRGVTATSVRNRVVMGPMEVDRTVTYNPPVFVARVPPKLGRTWQGSWQGKTSGSYTGRTFDHTTVVIEGEEVEVWASEVVMTMHGEVEGTVTTRSWYSPRYRMVVKQYQNMNVESGPGEYRSEWTGQVLSANPQT